MADSIKAIQSEIKMTLPANQTTVVDAHFLDCFDGLEYSIIFFDATTLKKRLNLIVSKTELGLATQVYGRSGSGLNLAIDAFIQGTQAELRVENMEAFDVNFVATKTTT